MNKPTIGYTYLQSSPSTVGVDISIAGLSKQQASDFVESVLALAKAEYDASLEQVSFFGVGPTITTPKPD